MIALVIMLKRYEKFLEEFDKKLNNYFTAQQKYIKCKKGCTNCCEIGEYPFSRLEAEYIMSGYIKLPPKTQQSIKMNISKILQEKANNTSERFTYRCPFLIDSLCTAYKYRGLTCRTFGLAYLEDNIVKLPECANLGLNYSEIFNTKTKELNLENPIKESLRIDSILRSQLAEKYELECGEIRPLIDWFTKG